VAVTSHVWQSLHRSGVCGGVFRCGAEMQTASRGNPVLLSRLRCFGLEPRWKAERGQREVSFHQPRVVSETVDVLKCFCCGEKRRPSTVSRATAAWSEGKPDEPYRSPARFHFPLAHPVRLHIPTHNSPLARNPLNPRLEEAISSRLKTTWVWDTAAASVRKTDPSRGRRLPHGRP